MRRRIAVMTAAWALGMPVASVAGANPAPAAIGTAPSSPGAPVIKGAHDKEAAWLVADYRQLQLRKRTDKTTRAIAITLQVPGDIVSVTLSQGTVTVVRNGKTMVLDSAESMASLQQLLGSSPAVFGTRSMLSELEQTSELTAPDMSLLSAAAFVSSLVGDVDAPQRLADRFMAKHRGLYRQVRMPAGTCWATYTAESTAAWNQLQDCMADANERDFFRAAYERLACNGVWLARSESAWFEYLNCLSPLSSFNP